MPLLDGPKTVHRFEMETVPKIVEERLKARAVTVDHPDPDVLTAFSERALLDRERELKTQPCSWFVRRRANGLPGLGFAGA